MSLKGTQPERPKVLFEDDPMLDWLCFECEGMSVRPHPETGVEQYESNAYVIYQYADQCMEFDPDNESATITRVNLHFSTIPDKIIVALEYDPDDAVAKEEISDLRRLIKVARDREEYRAKRDENCYASGMMMIPYAYNKNIRLMVSGPVSATDMVWSEQNNTRAVRLVFYQKDIDIYYKGEDYDLFFEEIAEKNIAEYRGTRKAKWNHKAKAEYRQNQKQAQRELRKNRKDDETIQFPKRKSTKLYEELGYL